MQKLKEFLIVELVYIVHFIVQATWRKKRGALPPAIQERIDAKKPVVFAHLHQDDISLSAFFRGVPVGVLVSHSKDGNLLTRYFNKIGFVVARGSSSKGAASGFLELLRLTKEKNLCWITFAIDGPRGPIGKSKNGVFKLAEILGAPVVPVVALANPRWTLNRSWSKTFIPKPFCKIEAKFLEPIPAADIKKYTATKEYSKLTEVLDTRIAKEKTNYM